MVWAICFLALVAVGFTVLVATGRLGEMPAEPVRDVYEPQLPAQVLSGRDVHQVALGVTLRGYAMNQVDDLLDRLATEIDQRDRIIERLAPPPAAPADDPAPPSVVDGE